jgi:MFS family permease
MGKTVESFLGFPDASSESLHLAKILFVLLPFANIIFTLSTTFYTIFVARALGEGDFILGLGPLGLLIVIQLGAQTILDYPSGAIGDWIGQRYVIACGNVLYGISFLMVSYVSSQTPYLYLVVIYALQGVASSQISGAWGAWFDNNYRIANPNDTDRKQYGVFWGRVGMITQIAATLSLIPGSVLAVIFSHAWVFQFQAVGSIIFAALVLYLIRDFPQVEEMREERPSMSEYIGLLKSGISFMVREPFVRFIVIGSMLTLSTMVVWGNLILFPMYYSYLLTDVAVAGYRTIAFIPGVAAQERSGIWSQRFEPKKWIPRFRFLQACGFVFYLIFATIMFFLPPINESDNMIRILIPLTNIELLQVPLENLLAITLILLTFTITVFFDAFASILEQRILLDVIPDRIRNSVYSLQPTILMLFAMPQIAIFGWLIPIIGFPTTLLCVGCISLCGVFVLRHGLNQPRTIPAIIEPRELSISDKEAEEDFLETRLSSSTDWDE